jgi:predicted NAD/FAD-binding protein
MKSSTSPRSALVGAEDTRAAFRHAARVTNAAITRRDVLRGAAVLGAGAALGRAVPARAAGRSRERVAIVGAGAGGIAAAYFLAGDFGVDVFEARDRIGGHCDSREIAYRGRRITVDIGAQFFHPDTHPIYVTLLEELGLYDPAHPDADATLEAPGSLCIFPAAGGPPAFTSTNALATPQTAVEFAQFTQLARNAVLSGMAWETTHEDWIAGLPLSAAFKADVLGPWLASLVGCSRAAARGTSARSILQTFALSFPADIVQGATTYNSKIGLQGNLQRLLDRVPSARMHLRTPVLALQRTREGWLVQMPAGRRGPYRHVLLNAPPRVGRRLVRPLRGFGDVADVLDAYTYFDSRLLIHTDPAYVQQDRANWTAYNAEIDGRECEGSAWLGALIGEPVDVFKSWAQRRRTDPRRIVAQRRFQHPLITPQAIRAARALRPLQGHGGLYFSGQYTTGMDLQESAVWSAMQVAQALAPASRTLQSLKARLAATGRAGVSYDL